MKKMLLILTLTASSLYSMEHALTSSSSTSLSAPTTLSSQLDNFLRVNQQYANETTPLFIAVQQGNASMVSELIAHGANVSHILPNGATPLSIALFETVEKKKCPILHALLQAGARPDAYIPKSTKAVYSKILALKQSSLSLTATENLINQKKANEFLTFKYCLGEATALYYAARYNEEDCVEQLLSAGADPNKGNKLPLSAAAESGSISMINLLLDTGLIENDALVDAVEDAIYGKQSEALQLLLASGVKFCDESDILELAVTENYGEGLLMLLSHTPKATSHAEASETKPSSTSWYICSQESIRIALNAAKKNENTSMIDILKDYYFEEEEITSSINTNEESGCTIQ